MQSSAALPTGEGKRSLYVALLTALFQKNTPSGALPGLTSKRPKAGNDLQNQSRSPETKDQGVKFDYNYLKCVWITSFLFRLGMASTIPQARPPIS